jgi:carbamoyl-phosphate synthase small subunit
VVRSVLDAELPYFGICLGHQLLARAIGADTSKLLFGHRGGNQPVRDERTGKVTITAQNHSFQVLADTLPQGDEWQAALINLNDGSVEGLAHRERPVISVQFHPEASPGPHDNSYLFDRFLDMIATGQQTPAVETR